MIAPKSIPRKPTTLSFVEGLRKVVEETEVRVLSLALARCPPSVAGVLGIKSGEEALHVVRVRLRNGVAVMLLDAWLPKRFEAIVTKHALTKRPLFNLITGEGKDVGKVVQEVNAEIADPFTAAALKIDLHSPVLRIERLMHDRNQAPVQFLTIRSSPVHSRLLMEVAGQDVNSLGRRK